MDWVTKPTVGHRPSPHRSCWPQQARSATSHGGTCRPFGDSKESDRARRGRIPMTPQHEADKRLHTNRTGLSSRRHSRGRQYYREIAEELSESPRSFFEDQVEQRPRNSRSSDTRVAGGWPRYPARGCVGRGPRSHPTHRAIRGSSGGRPVTHRRSGTRGRASCSQDRSTPLRGQTARRAISPTGAAHGGPGSRERRAREHRDRRPPGRGRVPRPSPLHQSRGRRRRPGIPASRSGPTAGRPSRSSRRPRCSQRSPGPRPDDRTRPARPGPSGLRPSGTARKARSGSWRIPCPDRARTASWQTKPISAPANVDSGS